MPQGVIDILEVIEVQAQQSEPLPSTELLEASRHFLVEQMPVRQTREAVMHGQIRDLGFRLRRSVTSSWVATQPPPGMGLLVIDISRPCPDSTIQFTTIPFDNSAKRVAAYRLGSSFKLPIAALCSSSWMNEQPGFTTSRDKPYISM